MLITNNHKTALGLNDGTLLQPGTPTPVPGWDAIKKNAVIAAWVKAGILTEGSASATPSKFVPANTAPDLGDDEKAELQAALEAKGIEFDKRWGIKKLRDALESADAVEPEADSDEPEI